VIVKQSGRSEMPMATGSTAAMMGLAQPCHGGTDGRTLAVTLTDDVPALVASIQSGDLATLQRLLSEQPGLASSPLAAASARGRRCTSSTDWPGYFPNGPQIARILIAAGADPNTRSPGTRFAETPLHWAASSDDVDVADALIDGGADVETPDGSIAHRSTTRSATPAGMLRGCSSRAARRSTSYGRRPPWAC